MDGDRDMSVMQFERIIIMNHWAGMTWQNAMMTPHRNQIMRIIVCLVNMS